MLERLNELKCEIRDNIGNKMIAFLINHCHLYASAYFAMTKKTASKEWEFYTKYCYDIYDYKK